MVITLPLEKMTTSQKIETMEAIWQSLCEEPEAVVSPAWHAEILAEREELVKEEDFIAWEVSKKEILRQLDLDED